MLVAECIPADDPVGAASRVGWDFAAENIGAAGERVTLELVETLSVDALRAAIADSGPDILVISAHGVLSKDRDVAGLQVGGAGRERHPTLLEAWHRVQTSNAVNDVLSGSASLHAWGMSATASGLPVIQEFMSVRSTGRLRTGHIYADTERILGEIADNQGNGARVRNWFQQPGYVPESLFYVFAGRPERLYLRPLVETVNNLAE